MEPSFPNSFCQPPPPLPLTITNRNHFSLKFLTPPSPPLPGYVIYERPLTCRPKSRFINDNFLIIFYLWDVALCRQFSVPYFYDKKCNFLFIGGHWGGRGGILDNIYQNCLQQKRVKWFHVLHARIWALEVISNLQSSVSNWVSCFPRKLFLIFPHIYRYISIITHVCMSRRLKIVNWW